MFLFLYPVPIFCRLTLPMSLRVLFCIPYPMFPCPLCHIPFLFPFHLFPFPISCFSFPVGLVQTLSHFHSKHYFQPISVFFDFRFLFQFPFPFRSYEFFSPFSSIFLILYFFHSKPSFSQYYLFPVFQYGGA